jgi:hypothetical protein
MWTLVIELMDYVCTFKHEHRPVMYKDMESMVMVEICGQYQFTTVDVVNCNNLAYGYRFV